MSENERARLRKQLRLRRDALQASTASRWSEAICRQLLEPMADARHVAAYYAMGNEVDLESAMSMFRDDGRQVYVPVVLPQHRMLFAPVDDNTPLISNQYGIREPQVDSECFVDAKQLDAVIVPLVGFDANCNRMGMGGGYYDRCFEYRRHTDGSPTLIGVAFEMQRVETVFAQDWDVPLDHIVTESRVITRPDTS